MNEDTPLTFDQVQQLYQRLKQRLATGELTPDEMQQALAGLRVTDEQGAIWQVGAASGRWYRRETDAWKPAVPPGLPPQPQKVSPAMWAGLAAAGVLLLGCVLTAALAGGGWAYLRTRSLEESSDQDMDEFASEEENLEDYEDFDPETDYDLEEDWSEIPESTGPEEAPPQIPTASFQAGDFGIDTSGWTIITKTFFSSPDTISGVWKSMGSYTVEASPVEMGGVNGLLLSYGQNIFLPDEDSDGNQVADLQDVEIELSLAFPGEVTDGAVELLCRVQPGYSDYYALHIQQNEWSLLRTIQGEEEMLALGETGPALVNGEWGWMRLSCNGSHIIVRDESGVLADVEDDTFSSGGTGTRLLMLDNFGETPPSSQVKVYYHRVLSGGNATQPPSEIGEVFHSGEVWVSTGGEMIVSDDAYLLETQFELRQAEGIQMEASQVFLESGDGSQAVVIPDPSVEGESLLQFPLDIEGWSLVRGNLVFRYDDVNQLAGEVDLVIDLTPLGLEEIRIPVRL
jgi:hypothetical protein